MALLSTACGGESDTDGPSEATISGTGEIQGVIEIWEAGTPAFGIFVPSERERGATDEAGNRLPPLYTAAGARTLAQDPMLDYLFLNLEGSYDVDAVHAMVEGLDDAPGDHRPTLLVRIPTIEDAGAEATRMRVAEVVAAGGDGLVIPHIRTPDEARLAVSFIEHLLSQGL